MFLKILDCRHNSKNGKYKISYGGGGGGEWRAECGG